MRMTEMNGPAPRSGLDAHRRQGFRALDAARYLLLAILVMLFTLASKHPTGASRLFDLGLCALAGAWMLWMFTLHPAWRSRQPVMTLFFSVLILIMAVLVIRDPWFGFFAPVGYSYAVGILPWPGRLAGVAAVAIVAATSQTSDVHKATPSGLAIYVAVLTANVLPMCGLTWFQWNSSGLHDQRSKALTEANEANARLEATLAENAGLHEQLLAQAREAGVLDERQRMAREIHDTLAQGLTGIVTQLQAAEQASEDAAEWRRHFAAATRLARESLFEARRSVAALRPEPLQAARLSEALARVAERWSALNGVTVQVTTTGTVRPVRPQAEFALLRTAQEALANVARHAHATKAALTLAYREHEVALDVRDNGKGFEPAQLRGDTGSGPADGSGPDGGFGLIAMRQRIEDLEGTLQVQSEPGAGTTISARVPETAAQARP
jgi:signal transduction histidine kinase